MSREKRRGSELPATAADEATAFATRRKVIKGLASTVPVALTLSNGAAMANASSHQCITNQPIESEPECKKGIANISSDWIYSPEKFRPDSSVNLPVAPDASEIANNGKMKKRTCVQYVKENDPQLPGDPYDIVGYNYTYKDVNGDLSRIFINQDGELVNGGIPFGNPLTASCGGSFI